MNQTIQIQRVCLLTMLPCHFKTLQKGDTQAVFEVFLLYNRWYDITAKIYFIDVAKL